GVRAGLDRLDLLRAPAERLERERAGAGAAVDHVEPVEALTEPVEERLLHAIGKRPRRETRRGGEASSPECAADDAEPARSPCGAHDRAAVRKTNPSIEGPTIPPSHAT